MTQELPAPGTPYFTGATLDRASSLRTDPEWLKGLLDQPGAAVLGASADRVALAGDGTAALLRHPIDRDVATYIDPAGLIVLGLEDGRPLLAADLERRDEAEREAFARDGALALLREAGAILPPAEAGLAAYLVALLNWHRRHRFCANCGAATEITEGGHSRHCPQCTASHFPRTDPVVIMLVTYDRQLLLGRRAGWPGRQYSLLAGFVSPGETPEEAVIREVREESGITAYAPGYVIAQPWPFPSSLMLGFEASSDGGTPRTNDAELEAVSWFPLEEVRRAVREESTTLRLPPPIAIARTLIDGWLARDGSRLAG